MASIIPDVEPDVNPLNPINRYKTILEYLRSQVLTSSTLFDDVRESIEELGISTEGIKDYDLYKCIDLWGFFTEDYLDDKTTLDYLKKLNNCLRCFKFIIKFGFQLQTVDVKDVPSIDYASIQHIPYFIRELNIIKKVTLSATSNVVWGKPITLTATINSTTSSSGKEIIFDDGVNQYSRFTDDNGVATLTLTENVPVQKVFVARDGDNYSNNLGVKWLKRNLTITPLHKGTLHYGHYLRYKVTDSTSGAIVTGLSGYIIDGYSSTQTNVTVNSSGYCQKQCNNGSKTSTSSTTYTGKCKINGNNLYNESLVYSGTYSYKPSLTFDSGISSVTSDTYCEAKDGNGHYYGKWYATGDYSMASALKGSGSIRSHLASSSGSTSCKTPEELYVRMNGKNGSSTVSGTVLNVGYYIMVSRSDNISTKFDNIKLQLYSGGWSTKATASRTTTLPSSSTTYTGSFSYVPSMSNLSNVRLIAKFTANTKGELGYAYISEFYLQVWYSPTQTFNT